jgi:hypothetical protein
MRDKREREASLMAMATCWAHMFKYWNHAQHRTASFNAVQCLEMMKASWTPARLDHISAPGRPKAGQCRNGEVRLHVQQRADHGSAVRRVPISQREQNLDE